MDVGDKHPCSVSPRVFVIESKVTSPAKETLDRKAKFYKVLTVEQVKGE